MFTPLVIGGTKTSRSPGMPAPVRMFQTMAARGTEDMTLFSLYEPGSVPSRQPRKIGSRRWVMQLTRIVGRGGTSETSPVTHRRALPAPRSPRRRGSAARSRSRSWRAPHEEGGPRHPDQPERPLGAAGLVVSRAGSLGSRGDVCAPSTIGNGGSIGSDPRGPGSARAATSPVRGRTPCQVTPGTGRRHRSPLGWTPTPLSPATLTPARGAAPRPSSVRTDMR